MSTNKEYEIVNVTDREGNVISLRIGRRVQPITEDSGLKVLTVGNKFVFEYKDRAGAFITSPVELIDEDTNKNIKIVTEDTIYYLKEM